MPNQSQRIIWGVGLVMSVVGVGQAARAQTCNIDFNNADSIRAFSDQVETTFAYFPTYYEHPCGAFRARVTELLPEPCHHEHVHLMYEDNCIVPFCMGPGGNVGHYQRDLACAGMGTGCQSIDFALQPRRLASMSGDHTIMIALNPTDGSTSNRYCQPAVGGDFGGCVSTAGKPFVPRSLDIVSDVPLPPDASGQPGTAVTVYGLALRVRRIQVNANPPRYAQVPMPVVLSARLAPGHWDLSSFGLVDRIFFDNYAGALSCHGGSYTVDNLVVDVEPPVGMFNLEPQGWSDSGGSPVPVDTSNWTSAPSALKVTRAGYESFRAPVLDTATLKAMSNKIALDVFVPAQQANPYWVGDIQLFASVPSAGINNTSLGNKALTTLQRNRWSTLVFDVDQALLTALRARHPDVRFDVAVNLASNLAPTLLDSLRFSGDVEPHQRCGDSTLDAGEECDDGNVSDGDGCSGTCRVNGAGSTCNVAQAFDLGSANTNSNVPRNACLKVTQYPGSWATTIQLQNGANNLTAPLPFSWSNCVGGGSGFFDQNWQERSLRPLSTSCPTLIRLEGSAAQNVALRWWGNGG